MLEKDNPYTFELEKTEQSRRDSEQADADLTALAKRLGLDPEPGKMPDALRDRLQDFTTNCHLSIGWYQGKLKSAIRARRGYFLLSLLMLALIPVALAGISLYLINHPPEQAAGVTSVTSVTAQLSAVLTGLLAFQRGLSAWLDRRQVVAGYSKACSDLKCLLYTFEQKWDGLATDPGKYAEFLIAIRTATAGCKDIVRVETDHYFQTLSYPTIDVGSILKSSASDAKDLVAQYAVTTAAPAAVDLTKAKLDQLKQRLAELETQLADARTRSDAAAVALLTPLRDDALRALRAALVSVPPAAA